MSIRAVSLVSGEFFHIYNRGNSKQKIFLDKEDYDRFVKLLYLCNSEKKFNFREDIVKKHIDTWDYERDQIIVSIGSWVLMPNHFHLYISCAKKEDIKEKEENSISVFIKKLCTAYSMYFNKKYSRTGKLFEDKFKSVYISNEIQAKYLFSYIHLNPVKLIDSKWKEEGIKNKEQVIDFLNLYRWSSYHEFSGSVRPESKIISKENFLDYFPDKKSFQKEIFDWLALGNS